MPRTREIRPGFFVNEDLIECSPLARLFFIGLWCHADARGCLEDRPRRLKHMILPGDSCDAEALTQVLVDKKLLERYQGADGRSFLWIPKFSRHQNVHPAELIDAQIPDPPGMKPRESQSKSKPTVKPKQRQNAASNGLQGQATAKQCGAVASRESPELATEDQGEQPAKTPLPSYTSIPSIPSLEIPPNPPLDFHSPPNVSQTDYEPSQPMDATVDAAQRWLHSLCGPKKRYTSERDVLETFREWVAKGTFSPEELLAQATNEKRDTTESLDMMRIRLEKEKRANERSRGSGPGVGPNLSRVHTEDPERAEYWRRKVQHVGGSDETVPEAEAAFAGTGTRNGTNRAGYPACHSPPN